MSNYGNIAIGVRLGRGVDALFVKCWTYLIMRGLRSGDRLLAPSCEMPHHYAAENLFIQFVESDCDSLLLIDDDMHFDQNVVEKIRESNCNYDILSALYVTRKYPHIPVDVFEGRARMPSEGIYDVSSVGFGFTLIKRAVIERLREITPDDEMLCQWSRGVKGEDFYFCERAIQQGFTVGLNADIKVGHRFAYVSQWDSENKKISIELIK